MRRPATFVLAVAVGLSGLTAAGASSPATSEAVSAVSVPAADPPAGDPGSDRALRRLRADADGPLRVHRDPEGVVDFVGTAADDGIDNPAGTVRTGPVRAAEQDLVRYGAVLGVTDPDDDLTLGDHHPSVSGGSVVRFDQAVSGVPVIGGQVVVSLDADGALSSIQATTSDAGSVEPARVGRSAASRTAGSVTAKVHGLSARNLAVSGGDLAVFDSSVFGLPATGRTHTVRRFEVSHGADVRELVLVDAVSGRVLLHVDDVQHVLKRAVCDRHDRRGPEASCTSPVRGEGGRVSPVVEVNRAYDFSGEVSRFYRQIGGLDLTELIGRGAAGSRTLASTVHYCGRTGACPYANAFWNGQEMFYGKGYAGADDVVGHEMTHGVISRYSDLFYFHQSGAINESLADVMGEILDHRFVSPRDSPSRWDIGEDLPHGALRNLARPGLFGQPDKMTSTRYDADVGLADSGGVHTNSGVGNKTAYLISQGGTFNGVTLSGIDAGDRTLTKTATLYLAVIESLTSASDYADLGRVLNQTCADLAGAGTVGFTTGDCADVAAAVRATELARQPRVPDASTPTDAPRGCPTGMSRTVLFDDERAAPGDEFASGGLWTRAPNGSFLGVDVPRNATSGQGSWFGVDPDPSFGDPSSSSLSLKNAVTVPTGGTTYLRFNHWYDFEYDHRPPRRYFDGGLVLVDDLGSAAGARQTASLPWVNGPTRRVLGSARATPGFGGVSNGYTSSRLDLSALAGRRIRPQFQVRGDEGVSELGWYLDDIEIYTCGIELPSRPRSVSVAGGVSTATVVWAAPARPGDGVSGYRVTGSNGVRGTVTGASARARRVTGLRHAAAYTFAVRALNAADRPGPASTVRVLGSRLSVGVARSGRRATRVSGQLLSSRSSPLRGRTVLVQRQNADRGWTTLRLSSTGSTGRVAATVGGRSRAAYRLVFPGATNLIGGTSGSRRL